MSHASPDDVARRAYALWETHGCQHGHDKDHWAQAERELAGSAPDVDLQEPPAVAEAPPVKKTRRVAAKATSTDEAGAAAPKTKRASRRAVPADA